MVYIHSKTACIWLKIQSHQQANYKDSTVNDEIVVNKWVTFYSKLNIYHFGFNKIFPGNLASSMIPILSNSKALEWDMLVIRTSEIGSGKFWLAVLVMISLQESRKYHYPILDGVTQLQRTCMKVACLRSELVDTGNHSLIKRLIGKKYFMYFENTKILTSVNSNQITYTKWK